MTLKERAKQAVLNLLNECVQLQEGQSLLIVTEDDHEKYYDTELTRLIKHEAEKSGASVFTLVSPRIDGPEQSPEIIKHSLEAVDHTIFLARIGDQMRFYPLPGKGSKTMCYTLDLKMLTSAAGLTSYCMASKLLESVQLKIDTIKSWHINCPLGTDLTGTSDPQAYANKERLDFTVKLFPPGPFRPLVCNNANGKIVSRFFPASATHLYEPFGLVLESPVTLFVENGRIIDFGGEKQVAERVKHHYQFVGEKFSIDPFVVHSWHAGTNPNIYYPDPAIDNIERWNGVMHSHTRYTHIHTCGNYGPGEISCGLIDASLTFDDQPLWEEGRLLFLESDQAALIRQQHGDDSSTPEMCMEIGL